MQKLLRPNCSPGENCERTDIPSGIKIFLKRRLSFGAAQDERRYSVSEIIDCRRKKFYKEMGEPFEDDSKSTLTQLWSSARGDFLHEITRAYKWRELDVDYDIILPNGDIVKLVGRLDIYDWKTRTVIDVKTSNFISWQIKNKFIPKSEHILQIQCYGTMFSQIVPVENLVLLYADMSDLYSFKVKNVDRTKWITQRIHEIEGSIKSASVPIGEVSALCKFCKYQKRCISDGGGLLKDE